MIDALRIKVPQKLGMAIVSLADNVRNYAGVDEDSKGVGRVTAHLLYSLVERGEKGILERSQRVRVRGAWCEGETLRRLPA